jgi:hypothetical protein
MLYIIARTDKQRPTLQHILGSGNRTLCGSSVLRWSREYQKEPLGVLLCIRCARAQGQTR